MKSLWPRGDMPEDTPHKVGPRSWQQGKPIKGCTWDYGTKLSPSVQACLYSLECCDFNQGCWTLSSALVLRGRKLCSTTSLFSSQHLALQEEISVAFWRKTGKYDFKYMKMKLLAYVLGHTKFPCRAMVQLNILTVLKHSLTHHQGHCWPDSQSGYADDHHECESPEPLWGWRPTNFWLRGWS